MIFPDCSICCEPLTVALSVTPCGHVYHTKCITGVVEKNMGCPLCRKSLTASSLVSLVYNATGETEVSNLKRLKKGKSRNELQNNLSFAELLKLQEVNDMEISKLKSQAAALREELEVNEALVSIQQQESHATYEKIQRLESTLKALRDQKKEKTLKLSHLRQMTKSRGKEAVDGKPRSKSPEL